MHRMIPPTGFSNLRDQTWGVAAQSPLRYSWKLLRVRGQVQAPATTSASPNRSASGKYVHSNKISKVQFGIQLCHTDPRLFSSFSTPNPSADIDRRYFHSVRLFTVEIWLEWQSVESVESVPSGSPKSSQYVPKGVDWRHPSWFSSGKPSAASSARPSAKTPRGHRLFNRLSF